LRIYQRPYLGIGRDDARVLKQRMNSDPESSPGYIPAAELVGPLGWHVEVDQCPDPVRLESPVALLKTHSARIAYLRGRRMSPSVSARKNRPNDGLDSLTTIFLTSSSIGQTENCADQELQAEVSVAMCHMIPIS
jgi:hypothetical protein